ncbi:MAG: methyltransferase domain-containing protein [Ferruginibacter sp.]
MKNHKRYLSALHGLNGLEVGGPSPIFTVNGFLPIYKEINNLDGCNFSNNTVWEGSIQEGKNYHYGNKTGFQIISDGTKLAGIPNGKYDFVLSCHSIEHIANPIKALTEWKRIITDDGYLVLVVPHKDQTFDHNRPLTTLEHLIKDYENNVQEDDSTHFKEVIALHDISKDDGINDLASLKIRTADNFNNRCVHQHVFNTPLVIKLADKLGLKIHDVQHFNPFNIIVLLQKSIHQKANNSFYLDPKNIIYQNNKFPSDKIW